MPETGRKKALGSHIKLVNPRAADLSTFFLYRTHGAVSYTFAAGDTFTLIDDRQGTDILLCNCACRANGNRRASVILGASSGIYS